VPIRVIDLRGVRDLENKLVLYSDRRGDLTHECEAWCDDLCREIFGVATDDTEFVLPPEYYELSELDHAYWSILDARDRHEARFRTKYLSTREQVDAFAPLGLDFADDHGDPLRCVKRFARPAEAAARNITGIGARMPERAQIAVQTFEDAITKEAQAFLTNKRKRV
jgi:hypothetical protein